MKRTLKLIDGSEEILEGTPDELADHQRKLEEKLPAVIKPAIVEKEKVLLGKGLLDFIKQYQYEKLPLQTSHPTWMISCPFCRLANCNQHHLHDGTYPFFTVTCDTAETVAGALDTMIPSLESLYG